MGVVGGMTITRGVQTGEEGGDGASGTSGTEGGLGAILEHSSYVAYVCYVEFGYARKRKKRRDPSQVLFWDRRRLWERSSVNSVVHQLHIISCIC